MGLPVISDDTDSNRECTCIQRWRSAISRHLVWEEGLEPSATCIQNRASATDLHPDNSVSPRNRTPHVPIDVHQQTHDSNVTPVKAGQSTLYQEKHSGSRRNRTSLSQRHDGLSCMPSYTTGPIKNVDCQRSTQLAFLTTGWSGLRESNTLWFYPPAPKAGAIPIGETPLVFFFAGCLSPACRFQPFSGRGSVDGSKQPVNVGCIKVGLTLPRPIFDPSSVDLLLNIFVLVLSSKYKPWRILVHQLILRPLIQPSAANCSNSSFLILREIFNESFKIQIVPC